MPENGGCQGKPANGRAEHVFDDAEASVRSEDDPVRAEGAVGDAGSGPLKRCERRNDFPDDPRDDRWMQPLAEFAGGQFRQSLPGRMGSYQRQVLVLEMNDGADERE